MDEENNEIAERIRTVFLAERLRDARAFAGLVFARAVVQAGDVAFVPEPSQLEVHAVDSWSWTPGGSQAPRARYPRGFYRPDLVVTWLHQPLLVIEVDLTTSGKAALGAILLAHLAARDSLTRTEALAPHRLWFQSVAPTGEVDRYQDRMNQAVEVLPREHRERLYVGQVVGVDDALDLATWQRLNEDSGRVDLTTQDQVRFEPGRHKEFTFESEHDGYA